MAEYLMYLRKSRQDDPNESLEEVLRKHEIELQEYALVHFGYRIPERDIYREIVSGETIDDRPKIQELFARLEKEDIKGVMVVESTRFTRGDLLDCGIVVRTLRYTNTLAITTRMTFDLHDEYQRKNFESELIGGNSYLEYTKKNLQQGHLRSKKRGNFTCSVAPYGYDRIRINKDWTLTPNEKEAHYVRLAFQMYADGVGIYTIVKTLDQLGAKPRKAKYFNDSVVRQMLNNEVYIGKIKIGNRVTEKVMVDGKVVKKRNRTKDYDLVNGKHEPLIDEELFYKVKSSIGTRTKEVDAFELRNMWAGLIRCKQCGSPMERAVLQNRKHRFRCKGKKHCNNISHNFDEVEDALISQLKAKLDDFAVRVQIDTEDTEKERESLILALRKQLKEEKAKQEKICELLENGIYSVDMFVSRNNKAKEEIERLELAIENAEQETPKRKEAEDYLVTFHQTLDMLKDETIPAKTKNIFLKKIIDVIYYNKDESGITLEVNLRM